MTGPEQVSVNVAALRVVKDWWYNQLGVQPSDTETRHSFFHLFGAIPEPEWELTDDMMARGCRAMPNLRTGTVAAYLRAMHRERLL